MNKVLDCEWRKLWDAPFYPLCACMYDGDHELRWTINFYYISILSDTCHSIHFLFFFDALRYPAFLDFYYCIYCFCPYSVFFFIRMLLFKNLFVTQFEIVFSIFLLELGFPLEENILIVMWTVIQVDWIWNAHKLREKCL